MFLASLSVQIRVRLSIKAAILNQPSILWHDYETWGVNPQKDFPCQFAAIRTDYDLNPIGKPLNWFCQIPNDYLPQPQACLVTGITPQQSLRDGLVEAHFIEKVHQQLALPNTCTAGYNSIRFDDEVTRNALYRNFYDPYAREWQNGNSRWDIIDLVRACYALRPEGINWVYKDDGSPSFRLEELTAANGIGHQDAHDALSDVKATIALAKLIKDAQPKLYDYVFNLRSKHEVIRILQKTEKAPLVHISSKLPAMNGCCTWIVPIAQHPTNKNATIVLNLALDPAPLINLSAEDLLAKLYQPTSEMNADEQRLPIKLIHVNKCPIIAPAKTLTEENANRLGIDRDTCLLNLKFVIEHFDIIANKILSLYDLEQQHRNQQDHSDLDVDLALYSGGFFSDTDKKLMAEIRQSSPDSLRVVDWQFDDKRLDTMLFRYRCRNFPQTLNDEELLKWQRFRHYRLTDPASTASIRLADFLQELELLISENQTNPKKLSILNQLAKYADNL